LTDNRSPLHAYESDPAWRRAAAVEKTRAMLTVAQFCSFDRAGLGMGAAARAPFAMITTITITRKRGGSG